MSVKFNAITGHIRSYTEGESYEGRDPYDCIVTVQFLTEEIAYLCGAKGDLSITAIKEIHNLLKEMGVKKILMERKGVWVERPI